MGFFRNLWDESLAGPAPDSGLRKLRTYNSVLSGRSNAPPTGAHAGDNTPVSRSITVLRTNSLSGSGTSTPTSPAGSSAAGSPFSATSPGGDIKKLTRMKSNADAGNRRGSKSPTGYDWIVLTSLDR